MKTSSEYSKECVDTTILLYPDSVNSQYHNAKHIFGLLPLPIVLGIISAVTIEQNNHGHVI